jgi:hypothetical protein
MTQDKAKMCFDKANQLWFHDGYTSKAIGKYMEALQLSGDDPVIAFQLASALLALGRREDALHYAAIADRRRQRLGDEGREELESLKCQCEADGPKRAKDGRQGQDFDIEKLKQQTLSKDDWFGIALSAQDMGIYGVAIRAYQFCDRGFLDLDLLRDEEELRLNIEQRLDLLDDLRQEMSA